ncbi:MAG: hypothetical protein RR203_07675 [Synergistaceae bacterium]
MRKHRAVSLVEILIIMPILLSLLFGYVAIEQLSTTEINVSKNTQEIELAKSEVLSYLSSGMSPNDFLKIEKPYVIKIIRQPDSNGGTYVLSIKINDKTQNFEEEFVWGYKN